MSTPNGTKSYEFINPYNFIPLTGNRAEGTKEKGTYTGVIDYSVLTKTPLFIPNTSNDNAFRIKLEEGEHKSYEFFSYTDLSDRTEVIKVPNYKPVIPGSEMRGMLRSYYEILTNSCMSAIDDNTVTLSKRTNQAYEAGLIKKTGPDTYDLYRAQDYLMRTEKENSLKDDNFWKNDDSHNTRKCYVQESLKEGREVFFFYKEPESENKADNKKMEFKNKRKLLARYVSDKKTDEQNRTGYVIKGEDGPQTGTMQQKHCCHIFEKPGEEEEPYRRNISLSTLDKVLKAYKDNSKDKDQDHEQDRDQDKKIYRYQEYDEQLKEFISGGGGTFFPVYYSEVPPYDNKKETKHLMLSPACITREIYRRTLREMIGTHASCTGKDKLCPACTLFGTIGSDFARTSRIRVADLVCTEPEAKECYDKPVTIAPLSSPKLNNMEFYLKRPKNAWFWTYDYYIDDKGNVHANRDGINGRKFYWHQPDMKLENQEANKLNMTIRPLKKNITFKGKLYFRNLTKTELDQLIYLLSAGDDKEELREKTHGYKLGGGKPLGLGSIAVSVDQVSVRSYAKDVDNHVVERKESTYDAYSVPEIEEKILRDFTRMTDFNAVKDKNISYPLTGESDNVFDWFVKNHAAYRYNKETGQNERISMPNARKQMVYAEYMEPMTPGLVSTGFLEHSVEQKKSGGNKNGRQNQPGSSGSRKIIKAVVTGINSYGNVYIREKDDSSKEGFIYADRLNGQNPQKGEEINVSFYKANNNGKNVYNIEV